MSDFWRPNINPEKDHKSSWITRGEWVDESRDNRRLPYKLYTPKEFDTKLPLIIWSHGLGGSRDGAGFLSRYLASHDYAVLNIQHPGTDISLWMGKEGHPWDIIRNTEITEDITKARFHDVAFILDQLKAGNIEGDMAQKLDLDVMGMSGHSFGALTTQVMAGQLYKKEQFKQDDFKAHIAYSQLPIWEDVDYKDKVYGTIDKPIFFMTGTEDNAPIEGHSYHKRLDLFEHASSPVKHSLVLQDGDHMVFAGSRGQLPGYDKIPQHENIIKVSSLAWWDWHLKDEKAAKDWLENSLDQWVAEEGDHQFR